MRNEAMPACDIYNSHAELQTLCHNQRLQIMRIEKYAFVPDVQYMCCSQPVVVYNVSGRYMSLS
jgi:hypothetical protein